MSLMLSEGQVSVKDSIYKRIEQLQSANASTRSVTKKSTLKSNIDGMSDAEMLDRNDVQASGLSAI